MIDWTVTAGKASFFATWYVGVVWICGCSLTPAFIDLPSNGAQVVADGILAGVESNDILKRPHVPSDTEVLTHGTDLKKQPTLDDFADVKVQALLLQAAHEYEALIYADGLRYEFTDRMLRLIKKRGSRVCGDLLEPIRTLVMSNCGFCDGGKARHVKKNKKIAADMGAGFTFHYKDPKTKTGYAGNAIFSNILSQTWFKDASSPGIIYKQYFNPISLETFTLMFSLVDFGIKEWDTGRYVPKAFKEQDIIHNHEAFRADLQEWHSLSIPVTMNKCKKMFDRACKNAGVTSAIAARPQLTGEAKECALQELEGYMGEMDSDENSIDGSDKEDDDA
ncbi:hypothetical protein H0H81_003962, partial [Sphagnurus paluster]